MAEDAGNVQKLIFVNTGKEGVSEKGWAPMTMCSLLLELSDAGKLHLLKQLKNSTLIYHVSIKIGKTLY
jgi:hypothetical protein